MDPNSHTETYMAMKLKVDNWRWAGVPIFCSHRKAFAQASHRGGNAVQHVPHLPFDVTQTRNLGPNALVLRIQPDEGITLRFGAKVPGQAFRVRTVSMDFSYGAAFLEETPDAYERLLLDAMVGDPPCSFAPTKCNKRGGSWLRFMKLGVIRVSHWLVTRPERGAQTKPTNCCLRPAGNGGRHEDQLASIPTSLTGAVPTSRSADVVKAIEDLRRAELRAATRTSVATLIIVAGLPKR